MTDTLQFRSPDDALDYEKEQEAEAAVMHDFRSERARSTLARMAFIEPYRPSRRARAYRLLDALQTAGLVAFAVGCALVGLISVITLIIGAM